MAITAVQITNLSTKAYAKSMVEDYQEMAKIEGFTGAAIVDPAEGATVSATAQQLKNVLKEKKLEDKIICRIIDKKIYLIDADLV